MKSIFWSMLFMGNIYLSHLVL